MSMTRILITGACGFLGTEIISALVAAGDYYITALDIIPPGLGAPTYSHVKYVRGNILEEEELITIFARSRPDVVIHTASIYPSIELRYDQRNSEKYFRVNVGGTLNVIAVAKATGVKALVYTSSVTVLWDELGKDFINADETWSVGRAETIYAVTKTKAERLILAAQTSTFSTCSLRIAPIFGPNDPAVVPTLHRCIARGETPFFIGSGTNLQDFVFVSNVAQAHLLAVRNLLDTGTAAGEAIFITNGEPVTLRAFCLALWKEFDHVPPFKVKIPGALAWWLGLGAECLSWVSGSKGTFTRGAILDATCTRYVSIDKARRILGYKPSVSLTDALKISCEDYKRKLADQAKR